jgi:GNAT superfamily N-acetyltransferase
MSEREDRFSVDELVVANEENLFAHSLSLGRREQGEVYDGSDIQWAYTGSPFLNRIFGACLGDDQVDGRITEVLARFKAWKAPLVWINGPSTRPYDLGQRLERQGFSHVPDWIGMVLDLGAPGENCPVPDGLTIEEVVDGEGLRAWALAPYGPADSPNKRGEAFAQVFVDLGLGDSLRYYLGLWHGEPVARSMLFVAAGVAGIYWVGTAEKARRQGIATALTERAVQEARARGLRWAVLQASEMGEGVYQRMGFAEHCRMGIYVWRP